MAQQRTLVGRVLAVAWRSPEAADIEAVLHDLASTRERLGRGLLYLSVIGPLSIPTGPVRDRLVEFYAAVLTHCDSMHVVIEGEGFEVSIKRSVIANILLVVKGRGRVFIENSLERVVASSPAPVRDELRAAIAAANARSLFEYARAGAA